MILFMLSCAALMTAATSAHAQENGFFFMERPKLGLGTSYEFEDETLKTPEAETKTTTHDFLETATIRTGGWLYHPNLMEYRFTFMPEWRQEIFEQSHTERRDTSVMAYDARATLLKRKPFSMDFFAYRNTRRLDLSTVQDTDFDNETWGTRLNFTNPTLPASIGFSSQKSSQSGFYGWDEDRNELQVDVRHNAGNSVTQLEMLYDDADRTTRTLYDSTDISSNALNTELTNTLFFTDDNRVRLDSLFYNNRAEYADADSDIWSASENLFWTHSRSLLTRYSINYNRNDFDSFVNEETALRAGLTHRLYDRLTTDLGGEAAFTDFSGGSEDLYRSNLGFTYNRPIPWGNVELGAGYTYDLTQRSGDQDIISTQEPHVLKIGEETLLREENILRQSILVTSITGATVYAENIDYRIQEIGPDVSISRSLLGSIADGQEVLIRYSYRIDASVDDARFGQDYRFDLDLWSFFYLTLAHGRLNQNVISGESLYDPIDDTRNSVRIRFDTDWTETQFFYEDQDRSNGNSIITRSVRQLINFRPLRNFYFNFSGDYGNRDFPDIDESEDFYSLGTNIGWTPRWWCTFSMVGLWDRVSGDHQDMVYTEIAPTVQLAYGVWTGTLSYRLGNQEDKKNGDSYRQQRIYLGITRSLW